MFVRAVAARVAIHEFSTPIHVPVLESMLRGAARTVGVRALIIQTLHVLRYAGPKNEAERESANSFLNGAADMLHVLSLEEICVTTILAHDKGATCVRQRKCL